MQHYKIEQDEVGASEGLYGCFAVTDVRKRLEKMYPEEEWRVYEGDKYVRLHRFPRKGWLAKLFGKGKTSTCFLPLSYEKIAEPVANAHVSAKKR